jgi:hypothetical protein
MANGEMTHGMKVANAVILALIFLSWIIFLAGMAWHGCLNPCTCSLLKLPRLNGSLCRLHVMLMGRSAHAMLSKIAGIGRTEALCIQTFNDGTGTVSASFKQLASLGWALLL